MAGAKTAAARQAAEPQVLVRDGDHLIFVYERFLATIWQVETRPDAVQQLVRFAAELAARLRPSRYCLLTVVEQSAVLPTAAVRADLANMLRDSTPHLIRFATAIEGSGFRAAAVRGVATSIAILSRQEFPHRVFASTDAALPWLVEGLARELGAAPGVEELASVLDYLRRPALSGTQLRR
ncbi:MAG TPA: hypothetical protein VMG12_45620 [Polyangiaceae bacterium]|nr:hypothetical protein [Polyangiaceae bacterium]